MRLGPAALFKHDHPPLRDATADYNAHMSAGERIADRLAALVGSWPFIIVQSVILALWVAANVVLVVRHDIGKPWDPYPFILLNLMLSFQAAYTGPIVMMSQNRQSAKDRLEARDDYECNLKAEEEIRVIMEHLAGRTNCSTSCCGVRVGQRSRPSLRTAIALTPLPPEASASVEAPAAAEAAGDRRDLGFGKGAGNCAPCAFGVNPSNGGQREIPPGEAVQLFARPLAQGGGGLARERVVGGGQSVGVEVGRHLD